MERFEAARAVDLIERYRVNAVTAVTIMLQRIARLPGIETRDLSSLEVVLHGGAPLPHWLADWWIDRVGPTHFSVSYGSSENAGACVARGDEWLAHRGTVGRPVNTELRILDDHGVEVPAGTVGNIYMRRPGQTAPTYDYRGAATPSTRPDLFSWLGDMGSVDEEGYLYLADRRVDMIISGGVNIYPAEVEAALSDHPLVNDVVVVGRPDPEWGQRVHAVVELVTSAEGTVDTDELREHCRALLAGYKVPKSIELVAKLPRTTAGKIRRAQFTASSSAG
jgi:bile acid-coenzyme A ligase